MSHKSFNPEQSKSIDFLREMVRNRPGGENRPQQEHAVLAIEKALHSDEHLLVQAGTGTGKSFATLIPAILSGKRVVYSTATKQLSEQLMNIDVPALEKEIRRQGGKGFSSVLLKGRENYMCLRKYNELTGDVQGGDKTKPGETDGLFGTEEVSEELVAEFTPDFAEEEIDRSEARKKRGQKPDTQKIKFEYDQMFNWARRTRTGDRSEAPAVSEEVWKGFSVNNNECVGRKSCAYGDDCYSEQVRAEAKKVQIVFTNHAVGAIELASEEGALLGPREVFIFDEVHEVDNFFSSAWGTIITEKTILDALKVAKRFTPSAQMSSRWEKTIEAVGVLASDLNREMLKIDDGLIWPKPLPYSLESTLEELDKSLRAIAMMGSDSVDEGQKEQIRRTIGAVSEAIGIFLVNDEENVRWCRNESMKKEDEWTKNRRLRNKGKKKEEHAAPSLHCAPMRIGPRLMSSLADKDATMIGTSATIAVSGKFDTPIHDFGLDEQQSGDKPRDYAALDVGTPFDYSKQAMFYVPDSREFPSAEYKSREEHASAVEKEIHDLVEAMGGRGLILTTTTKRINEIADYLEDNLKDQSIRILRQGDMPAPQLIDAFVKEETSVLVATMGMWHGLNAEGATCMLVVMDKIPFATIDDPLATARQAYSTSKGRNGFMEVYVASANIRIAQGFGRLIRTVKDRGIVAMLDTRISTKSYGREMMKSLPHELRTFNKRDVVIGAANRLREAREAELENK